MKRLCVAVVLLLACGDGGSSSANAPFEGTWVGTFTNNVQPKVASATLELAQDGEHISGVLTTNTGRTATVTGTASGDAFDATLIYTDGCEGTMETTATLNDESLPNELTGDYASSDCVGETVGSYRLLRQ